jgi:hypothetical protein
MNATTPRWTVTTDSWSLARMREAQAFRRANPGVTVEEQATDIYLDAYLAACEDAAAEVGTTTERATADEAPALRGTGSGNSTGGNRNAPTDGQIRFLASLARDLGYELQTPRDKSHASLIIDGAKKALDKARREGTAAVRPERKATEGQISYLTDLLATRVAPEGSDYALIDPATLSFADASLAIDVLSKRPRATAATSAHGIREGRYAFQPEDAQAMFLRVSRTGRVYSQAGPSEHPYRGTDTDALRWIAANPREAAALYGQLIGCCGRCGRELTDETSRSAGLGPDCAKKADW